MCKMDPAAKRAAYFANVHATAKRIAENARKDQLLADWRKAKEIEHINNAYYSTQCALA